MPAPTTVVLPVDASTIPKLPNSIRELDPLGVDRYEKNLLEFWLRVIDSINSLGEKVDS